jgi:hypothetical protein
MTNKKIENKKIENRKINDDGSNPSFLSSYFSIPKVH